MADNYTTEAVTTPSKTFASDEIIGGPTGNADWPFVKPAFGPLNTATIVEHATGKRLPVQPSGLEAGSVVSGQVSLTGLAAALPTVTGRRFKLKAHSAANDDVIYIGPAGVTTANGYPLYPGDEIIVEITNLNIVSAIVGSGTQQLWYFGEV